VVRQQIQVVVALVVCYQVLVLPLMPIQFTQSQSVRAVLLDLSPTEQTHHSAHTLLRQWVVVEAVIIAWLVNLAVLVAVVIVQLLFKLVVLPHLVKAMRAVTVIQLLVAAVAALGQ